MSIAITVTIASTHSNCIWLSQWPCSVKRKQRESEFPTTDSEILFFFFFILELNFVSVFTLHAIQFSYLLHWQVFMYTCYRFCRVQKKTITPNFPFSLPWVAVFFFWICLFIYLFCRMSICSSQSV